METWARRAHWLFGRHCRTDGFQKNKRSIHGRIEGFVVYRNVSESLKNVRKTVSKMMPLQWTNELDIDTLESTRRASGCC